MSGAFSTEVAGVVDDVGAVDVAGIVDDAVDEPPRDGELDPPGLVSEGEPFGESVGLFEVPPGGATVVGVPPGGTVVVVVDVVVVVVVVVVEFGSRVHTANSTKPLAGIVIESDFEYGVPLPVADVSHRVSK